MPDNAPGELGVGAEDGYVIVTIAATGDDDEEGEAAFAMLPALAYELAQRLTIAAMKAEEQCQNS